MMKELTHQLVNKVEIIVAYKNGIVIQVDHTLFRSKYSDVELDPDNLQAMCRPSNIGKCNVYEDDWWRL